MIAEVERNLPRSGFPMFNVRMGVLSKYSIPKEHVRHNVTERKELMINVEESRKNCSSPMRSYAIL